MINPKQLIELPISVQIKTLKARLEKASDELRTIQKYPALYKRDYAERCKGFENAISTINQQIALLTQNQVPDLFELTKQRINRLNKNKLFEVFKKGIVRKAQTKAVQSENFELCKRLNKLLTQNHTF